MRTNSLMILISIFFAACSNNNSKQEETKKTSADSAGNIVTLTGSQIQNAQLQTGTIQQKQLSSVIKVNGSIDVPPQNTVSVSVPLGGYLKSTQLLPGMHVNKGQTIAVMEDLQ